MSVERAGRRYGFRALAGALVLGCLLLAAPFDFGAFVRLVGSDHGHAIRTIVDGIHVDLILAHESAPHPGESDPHLHAQRSDDHVVHLARGDFGPAQRRDASAPEALPVRIALPARVVAWVPAPDRPVRGFVAPPRAFSRRSVVLRT